jgi:hypothetical protein
LYGFVPVSNSTRAPGCEAFVSKKFTGCADNFRMAFGMMASGNARIARKSRELRAAKRGAVGEPGWIRQDGGFAKRPCTVLDISDTGVRLKVSSDQTVPSIFNFVLAKTGGLGRRTRVKWKRGNEIGAEFF